MGPTPSTLIHLDEVGAVDLLAELEKNQTRKKQQAEKGLDGLSYF